MLQIISPAKSLDFSTLETPLDSYTPKFVKEANKLVSLLQTYSEKDLQTLLEVSDKITALNYTRFKEWNNETNTVKQALFAYNGDVYEGINPKSLSPTAITKIQKNLRIISGLYGVLQPFDAIKPYRLEMGSPFKTDSSKNLYEFWRSKVTDEINAEISKHSHSCIINLASQEYSKVIDFKKIQVPVYTCNFKEYNNGKPKMISFFAKKARGLMVRYIAENNVEIPEHLIGFDYEGYNYNAELSSEHSLMFTR